MTKISDIKANPKNPRKITDEQREILNKSMIKFGDLGGIIDNIKSGFLVGGHRRIDEMQGCEVVIENKHKKKTKAGTVAEGYVIFKGERFKYRQVDWDQETEEAAMLAANKAGGDWDNGKLIDVVKGLMGKIDMSLTGFTQKEIAKLLPKVSESGNCDPDHIPGTPKKPKTERGDVYEFGGHRLICGDATVLEDVEKLMDGAKAQLVITDPPYNVAVNEESSAARAKTRKRRTDDLKIQNDKMSEDDFNDFLFKFYTNYFIIMADGAGIYVFYADSVILPYIQKFKDAGFHFAQNCIWNKQQFTLTRKDYHSKHEPIAYGWKEGAAHNWYGDRKQSTVWDYDRPFKNELHPTMKPIELLEYPIQNSSLAGDIVVDLFGGSGSTLIACEKTKRRAFLAEIEPAYCDVIINRYIKFTNDTDIKLNGKSITWKVKANE